MSSMVATGVVDLEVVDLEVVYLEVVDLQDLEVRDCGSRGIFPFFPYRYGSPVVWLRYA